MDLDQLRIIIISFLPAEFLEPQLKEKNDAQVTAQVTAEVTAQVVMFCKEPRSAKEIMAELNLKHWKTFQTNYLLPMINSGILERTIPDKPRSSKQKYRITEKGEQHLKAN